MPSPLHLLILLACVGAAASAAADGNAEAAALLSFTSLLYDPNSSLSSWSDQNSSHVCAWEGVGCRNGSGPVTQLWLDSLGLAGTISPSLAALTSLETLHLGVNQFNGSIPPELGRLPQLRYLNLSHNALSGGIPDELSNCSKLETLSADNNMLSGGLPASLARCSRLHVICLTRNQLTGEIPREYGSLPELEWLYLDDNKLSGVIPASIGSSSASKLNRLLLSKNSLAGGIPESIGNLTSLVYLFLDGNNLVGRIPSSLGNFSNLTYLNLRNNQLEGDIPPSLGRLTGLTILDLSFNKLSGIIPSSIYNLSLLTSLNLGKNRLTGTLSPDIGNALPSLRYFNVQGNSLGGPVPPSLTNATALVTLDLSTNHFNGVIPANLGRLTDLTALNLQKNRLRAKNAEEWKFLDSLRNCTVLKWLLLSLNDLGGKFPASFCNLSPQLEWLSLEGLRLSGEIPSEIHKLRGLQRLHLNQNDLTGRIPSSIGSLRNMTQLHLFGNQLSGPIPGSLAKLGKLEVLHLGDNRLQGIIPTSFQGFMQLNELNLSYNQLNGTIPGEVLSISSLSKVLDLSHNSLVGPVPRDVEKLKLLVLLDLSGNKLSGDLPGGLGGCETLNELYLESNSFEGVIPPQLSNLKSLQRVDFSRNKLSGEIPEFLAEIKPLEYLNLSFNNFDGAVPTEGAFANGSEAFVEGNPKLCGGSAALQLPKCGSSDAKTLSSRKIVAAGIAGVILLLLFLPVVILIWKKLSSSIRTSAVISSSPRNQFKTLSYADLHKATDGFSASNLIGAGSFSSVYKGILEGHQNPVAVKVLNLGQRGALKSYMAECEALRAVRHRNLVKIVTCCSTIDHGGNDFKALVFEFIPRGSLKDWLHPSSSELGRLSLAQRLDIAIDVATALEYLHHHHGQTPIVHCDVKPSNVLLGDAMRAQLGDFGLSKFLSPANGDPTYSIALRGSIGYIPPEYGLGVEVSTHGDVYSYGILVLEMVTGRTPTDEMFYGGRSLRSFTSEGLLGRVSEVVDPAMLSACTTGDESQRRRTLRCLAAMIELGVLCSGEAPHSRMDMGSARAKMVALRSAYLGPENGDAAGELCSELTQTRL